MLLEAGWASGGTRESLVVDAAGLSPSLHPTLPNGFNARLTRPHEMPLLESFITTHFSESWHREAAQAFETGTSGFVVVVTDERGDLCAFAASGATNPGWLGPLGVRPNLRNRGLGTYLVHRTIIEATRLGQKTLVIPWVGDAKAFYARCLPRVIAVNTITHRI
jgi:predicted N-acetyltransferase YhbS